jgi:hypothetical protein
MHGNGPVGRVTSSGSGGAAGVGQENQGQGADHEEREAANGADRAAPGTASDDAPALVLPPRVT